VTLQKAKLIARHSSGSDEQMFGPE